MKVWKILSRPNLDLFRIRQSNAAPSCKNYAKLYFDAKYIEKGVNRGWWNFWVPFFGKSALLANIEHCLKFLGLALPILIGVHSYMTSDGMGEGAFEKNLTKDGEGGKRLEETSLRQ